MDRKEILKNTISKVKKGAIKAVERTGDAVYAANPITAFTGALRGAKDVGSNTYSALRDTTGSLMKGIFGKKLGKYIPDPISIIGGVTGAAVGAPVGAVETIINRYKKAKRNDSDKPKVKPDTYYSGDGEGNLQI